MPSPPDTIAPLVESPEPSVRYLARTRVLGEDPASPALVELREEVRRSPRVAALLSERGRDGRIPHHPYAKWLGAHWVLAALADLGYPPGDASLAPLRDQVDDWLLHPDHGRTLPTHRGLPRLHASMEANAVLAQLRLGLADERTGVLVRRLLDHQWPDGGWNCDRDPGAQVSSFHETLLPLQALAAYAASTGDVAAAEAARRAAEVFLGRKLFRRRRDGAVINARFLLLHYPRYWYYDVLGGLVAIAEAGLLADPRCAEALDLLASKQLPADGWPAEARHYTVAARPPAGAARVSLVAWGPTGRTRPNEWVTLNALAVLRAAGRF